MVIAINNHCPIDIHQSKNFDGIQCFFGFAMLLGANIHADIESLTIDSRVTLKFSANGKVLGDEGFHDSCICICVNKIIDSRRKDKIYLEDGKMLRTR